jgi:WD40 repeat protein
VFPLDKRIIGLPLAVAVSPNGLLVAAGLRENGNYPDSKTHLVHVWELPKGNEIFKTWDYSGPAKSVAFSPDGKLLAIGGENGGKLEIWDLKTEKQVHSIAADKSSLFCVAFNPDGKTIATGGTESEVKLWNVESGKFNGFLRGHSDQVHALSFSKEGKKLASAGADDKSILIWNLETDVAKVSAN